MSTEVVAYDKLDIYYFLFKKDSTLLPWIIA
jgi:hypothetical protein